MRTVAERQKAMRKRKRQERKHEQERIAFEEHVRRVSQNKKVPPGSDTLIAATRAVRLPLAEPLPNPAKPVTFCGDRGPMFDQFRRR